MKTDNQPPDPAPSAVEKEWNPMLIEHTTFRRELRNYLDTLKIDGDNIGEIRRSLFVPWDSSWNGIVRDETALRENPTTDQPAAALPVSQKELEAHD